MHGVFILCKAICPKGFDIRIKCQNLFYFFLIVCRMFLLELFCILLILNQEVKVNCTLMKNNILITMGLLIVVGLAVADIAGVAIGILLASIVGMIYGCGKKDKQFVKWSVIAFVIDVLCALLFWMVLA
jgi:hypothetical protein